MTVPYLWVLAPFMIGVMFVSVRSLPVTHSRQVLPTRREVATFLWSIPVAYFIAQATFSDLVSVAVAGFLGAVFVPGYIGVFAGRRVFLWSLATVVAIWLFACLGIRSSTAQGSMTVSGTDSHLSILLMACLASQIATVALFAISKFRIKELRKKAAIEVINQAVHDSNALDTPRH